MRRARIVLTGKTKIGRGALKAFFHDDLKALSWKDRAAFNRLYERHLIKENPYTISLLLKSNLVKRVAKSKEAKALDLIQDGVVNILEHYGASPEDCKIVIEV